MPAFAEEIEAVHAAGIEVLDNSEIGHCEPADGGCWIQLDQTGDGRQLTRVKAGCVVIAIGQMAPPLTTGTRQALSCAANGRLLETPNAVPGRVAGSTSSNVFVAGDLGAANHQSLIGAIGSGKRAATGVRQLLEERPYPYEGERALAALHREMPAQRPRTSVLHPLAADPGRGRRALLDYALVQACAHCSHCIDDFGCPSLVPKNGQITIDQATCTGCGLCIEVCPNGAIHAALESPASS
jgi:heterodisulfide reductase subunit A-like polyferredoxin